MGLGASSVTERIVTDIPSARAHAPASRRTCSEVTDPSTHATIRETESGSGHLRGRGVHPGLSADGPSATIGCDERCNTDLATEPTSGAETVASTWAVVGPGGGTPTRPKITSRCKTCRSVEGSPVGKVTATSTTDRDAMLSFASR